MYCRALGVPRHGCEAATVLPVLLNKWYFDELYERFSCGPLCPGRGFWKAGDGAIIDGSGRTAIARLLRFAGAPARCRSAISITTHLPC